MRGKIGQLTKEDLIELVQKCDSLSHILREIGLQTRGTGNFNTLKKRLQAECIDFESIYRNYKSRPVVRQSIPLNDILVENSTYSRTNLKNRLIKDGYLIYHCYECELENWNGKPIALQLDHINGIPNDNRLKNLRLLCPNCHSQTDNFGGKKFKKIKSKTLNKERLNRRKVKRPSKEDLQVLLWQEPSTSIASRYGVSDKAIAKWAKSYGLNKPPRGYWS